MLDRDADFRMRRHAARQAQEQFYRDPRRIAALYELVWGWGYPDWQQQEAIDQLVDLDGDAFQKALTDRFASVARRKTRRALCEKAIEQNWAGFTLTALKSYAQPDPMIPDADRPERVVIEHFYPGLTVEQVVRRVFTDSQGVYSETQHVAAWQLLNRLANAQTLGPWLGRVPMSTPLIADLKAAAEQLRVMPRNREGILWLRYLRHPDRCASLKRAGSRVRRLTPSQQRCLQLRHLPVIAQLDQEVLAADRNTLLRRLQRRLPDDPQGPLPGIDAWAGHPQRLSQWENKLSWADLATIDLINQALGDDTLTAQLFAQADADHHDRRSETGGVIDRVHGSFTARRYEPLLIQHDRIFHPPPAMIEHLYTALAHYHFHAQAYRHRAFAVPGRGDRLFADRMNFNCLLFTFVDRDSLNVDYYQPGGVVIDLGIIRRPLHRARSD